jgi:hypothetical protein
MVSEYDSPTRAEIEAVLWVTKETEQPNRISQLTDFLRDRGLNEQEIDKILVDLDSYQNWNVEPLNAERSASSGNAES